MVLPFKQQFVTPILDGTKIHTLRTDEKRRWKSGKTIHFATGVRTKNYKQFHENTCKSVQTVHMSHVFNDVIQISVNGRELFGFHEHLAFAKNDGFDTWESFFDWFYPLIKSSEDEFLVLRLIHWTDFRY
jgi:hypothetical protein